MRGRAAVLNRRLQEVEFRQRRGVDRELELLRADVATLERQSLECELSLQLANKKWNELKPREDGLPPFVEQELCSSIRDIGLKLNQARIKKRTYDYLAEHLRHESLDRDRSSTA
jgi:hypothetical protein